MRPRVLGSLLALLVIAAASPLGCATGGDDTGVTSGDDTDAAVPPPGDAASGGCKTNADCAASKGHVCSKGQCVGCASTSDCPAGQLCANGTCAAGCDATHGCAAGQACCSGMCTPTDTVQSCGACGVACDATHSMGAACTAGACTYTGCASGFADCDKTAPDTNGCETDLNATGKKVCASGACVPSASCCTAADCTTPPGPSACFGMSTCPASGTCDYPKNPGAVVCNGNTCCNPINGTCNPDCTLTCAGGFGHCTGDPSKGCETNTTNNPADCGQCGRGCSGSNVANASCANGVCNSTCSAGWGNCSEPAAPNPDDGCESNLTTCAGTPCCTSGVCQAHHNNGLGQTYSECVAFGSPGNAGTYTATMATEAAKSWPNGGGTVGNGTCVDPNTGANVSCAANYSSGQCAVWCYAGTIAGYVLLTIQSGSGGNNCFCPTTSSASWN